MNLKTEVRRKQSTPNSPKNKHFLRRDTHMFFGKFGVLCFLMLGKWSYSSAHYAIVTPPHTIISGRIICDIFDVNFFWHFSSFGFTRVRDLTSTFYLIVQDSTYQCGNPGWKSRGSKF